MAPRQSLGGANTLDDVHVMGAWNFTLQAETPLHWLRCGRMDRYHMRFRVHSPCPSTCGMVMHAEADGSGTDGVSFWIERRPGRDGRQGSKTYLVSGDGLDSTPIVTRPFPDLGGDQEEEVEILVQGFMGCIFVQDRKVQLKFRTKNDRGCVAFYNSTQGEKDDVTFSAVRITALRRGPMEVAGVLSKRELALANLGKGTEPSAQADEARYEAKRRGQSPAKLRATAPAGPCGQSRLGQQLAGGAAVRAGQLPSVSRSGSTLQRSLGHSTSDSVFRKTGTAALSAAPSLGGTGKSGLGGRLVALALNAPASERQLLLDASPPPKCVSKNACQDFIVM